MCICSQNLANTQAEPRNALFTVDCEFSFGRKAKTRCSLDCKSYVSLIVVLAVVNQNGRSLKIRLNFRVEIRISEVAITSRKFTVISL